MSELPSLERIASHEEGWVIGWVEWSELEDFCLKRAAWVAFDPVRYVELEAESVVGVDVVDAHDLEVCRREARLRLSQKIYRYEQYLELKEDLEAGRGNPD